MKNRDCILSVIWSQEGGRRDITPVVGQAPDLLHERPFDAQHAQQADDELVRVLHVAHVAETAQNFRLHRQHFTLLLSILLYNA